MSTDRETHSSVCHVCTGSGLIDGGATYDETCARCGGSGRLSIETRGSAMCTLCGAAGSVETDMAKPEALASALAWAVHFTADHPGVIGGASRYVVMTEDRR